MPRTPNFLHIGIVNRFLTKVGTKFFTVTFRKKDGKRRTMTCQLGVKKGLKGGSSTTYHIDEIQVVYVGALQARRSFYKDQVYQIKCAGKVLKPLSRKVNV